MSLRVNLYGNVCNNAYVIGKFLRRAGVDAHLFLERGFPWLPEFDDPELEGRYPPWIHLTGDLRWRRYGLFDGKFVRLLGDCDVVHTFAYGPIWAQKTGRPFVFQTYGGDLNVLPFMTDSLHHRYLASRQRRGIRRAARVFLANPDNVYRQAALRRLQLSRVEVIPVPVDATKFRPLNKGIVETLRSRYDSEWIFFHPARQIWSDSTLPAERKGNDRALRAFARFLRATRRSARLIAVSHGPDSARAKALVHDLGIADAVEWIAPVRRSQLVELYNVADIVLDQFVLGSFGGCAFEAWACAKPVFTYLESLERFYRRDPPVVNVSTEDEIYEKLVELTDTPGALEAIGAQARQWVLENQDGDALMERYISAYQRILADGGRT